MFQPLNCHYSYICNALRYMELFLVYIHGKDHQAETFANSHVIFLTVRLPMTVI